MAGLTGALAAARPRRLELQGLLCTVVLGVVALCVVFPLLPTGETAFTRTLKGASSIAHVRANAAMPALAAA